MKKRLIQPLPNRREQCDMFAHRRRVAENLSLLGGFSVAIQNSKHPKWPTFGVFRLLYTRFVCRVYSMTTNTIKRVNISLPVETLNEIDSVTTKGNRSQFIAKAVDFYVQEVGKKKLRNALKEGALQQSKRDTFLASEWFNLDEDTWQKSK